MHIFPGLNYFPDEEKSPNDPVQRFWKKGAINKLKKDDPDYDPDAPAINADFFNDFASILTPFKDRIPLCLGSHIHRMTYISPLSYSHPDLDLKFLVSPSITPVYFNDPGFTVVHLNTDRETGALKVQEISLNFFSLDNIFMYGQPVWRLFKVSEYLGINIDSAEQLREYWQKMMNNPQIWAQYETLQFGKDWLTSQMVQFVQPWQLLFGDKDSMQWTMCLSNYYEKDDPQLKECAKSTNNK